MMLLVVMMMMMMMMMTFAEHEHAHAATACSFNSQQTNETRVKMSLTLFTSTFSYHWIYYPHPFIHLTKISDIFVPSTKQVPKGLKALPTCTIDAWLVNSKAGAAETAISKVHVVCGVRDGTDVLTGAELTWVGFWEWQDRKTHVEDFPAMNRMHKYSSPCQFKSVACSVVPSYLLTCLVQCSSLKKAKLLLMPGDVTEKNVITDGHLSETTAVLGTLLPFCPPTLQGSQGICNCTLTNALHGESDIVLLPCHMGTHMPYLEDLSPFLEGGCCYSRSL